MPNTLKQALAKEALTMWQDYIGADAVTLEIIFKLDPGQSRELWLEQLGNERQFGMLRRDSDTGRAAPRVRPGNYALEYRGKAGAPGQEYDIEVTAPPSAKWKPDPKKRADESGNVVRVKTLEVR